MCDVGQRVAVRVRREGRAGDGAAPRRIAAEAAETAVSVADVNVDLMDLPNKTFWYAMGAIVIVAVVYSFDAKIGALLAVIIILAALGNMYSAGAIKPAKKVSKP